MEDFRSIGRRLSNWGRWGKDDERGTTNFITQERIVEAAKLIRTGKVFDLGIPFGSDGPQSGAGGRIPSSYAVFSIRFTCSPRLSHTHPESSPAPDVSTTRKPSTSR